jgi:hypothetical protein
MMMTTIPVAVLTASAFAAAAAVVTYPAPEAEILSADYQVRVDGKRVDVYTARVLDPPFAGKEYDYGGPYAFANFDVSGAVEVRITSQRPLRETVIRPAAPEIKMRLEGDNTLILSLPGPRKLSVEPDGKKGPLLLFANPLEENPPKAGSPGVIFFGPGIHQPGRIAVTNGQTLYLAGGAVVKGGVAAEGENIRITGRGILDSSEYEWRKGPTPCVVNIRGTNVEVSGITIRGASHWTIVPRDSRRVTVRGVKLCGSRVQNDDGINPCNSQEILITDCFIRTDDDCVALKGLDFTAPNSNVERITVEHCVLWCDRARIFLLGHESRAPFMRDITLRDLDIIHFSMTPFLFEPGEEMRLENVLVENVRVHGEGQPELLRLKPVINQYMRNKVPGHVQDIRFSNVRVEGQPGGYAVQLSGADETHQVREVAFENVGLLDEVLSASSRFVQIGSHVKQVWFDRPAMAQLAQQRPDGEFPGWRSFHETPGCRTADVWRLQPDGVLLCKGTPRGYLYTEQDYTNFVLQFEWRYPAGATNSNGGVLVRMTGEHAVWPRCLEFQLNQGQAGDFWAIQGYEFTGPADRFKRIPESQFGALRHLKRAAEAEKPAGQWNRFEGIVQDAIATQKVNGLVVNQATGCEQTGGKILLTSEGQEIQFRNVRLIPRP